MTVCFYFQQQQPPSRGYQQQTQQQTGYKRSEMSPTTAMTNTAQYSQGQASWSSPFYRSSGPSPRYNPQQQLAAAYGSYTSQVRSLFQCQSQSPLTPITYSFFIAVSICMFFSLFFLISLSHCLQCTSTPVSLSRCDMLFLEMPPACDCNDKIHWTDKSQH